MNAIMDGLRRLGCDVNGAVERLMGDEELYLRLIRQVAGGDDCERLGEALRAGNATRAFELAHTLKGMLGNMGLTPLYEPACAIVERLRPGRMADVDELYLRLSEGYQELRMQLS